MTQVCGLGRRDLKKRIRDLLANDEVFGSRLGDSIVSMESLKTVTRGIFHGAWRDSSTQASPSFLQ